MQHPLGDELTELHVHLGGAVDPAAMWGIAHDQGIRLPTKDYWEFVDLITVRKQSKKAIAYKHRGIVGIDIAGGKNPDFRYRDYSALFKKARKAGLGITVHAGEDEDWESVDEVLQHLEPDRIGHGIHAARNAALCRRLAERGVLLEICPSSNLDSKVVKDADELGEYIAVFKKHKVRFSFNTDGPEMLETTLRDELRLAVRSGWVTKEELAECGAWAEEASFLPRNGRL